MMVVGPLASAFGALVRQIGSVIMVAKGLSAAYQAVAASAIVARTAATAFTAASVLSAVGFGAVAVEGIILAVLLSARGRPDVAVH